MTERKAPRPREDGPYAPTMHTLKLLSSVAGNQCAFPGCTTIIADPSRNLVLCEVAHIEAESIGGARYNEHQKNSDRHGFANLMYLCPTHHTEVDALRDIFTTDVLHKMKREHEAAHANSPALSDSVLESLLSKVVPGTTFHGPVVGAIHGDNAQVATTINNNYGTSARKVSQVDAERLIARLKQYPAEIAEISTEGGNEPALLGDGLGRILRAAGLTVILNHDGEHIPPFHGIDLVTVNDNSASRTIREWFQEIGLPHEHFPAPTGFSLDPMFGERSTASIGIKIGKQ